ncbi:hypothetical protein D3C75_1319300 [compost metagenome]
MFFTEQLLLMKVMLTQHLGARSFIKSDVTGVVDHTTGICVFKVNTNRPSKQLITHETSKPRQLNDCYYTQDGSGWEWVTEWE